MVSFTYDKYLICFRTSRIGPKTLRQCKPNPHNSEAFHYSKLEKEHYFLKQTAISLQVSQKQEKFKTYARFLKTRRAPLRTKSICNLIKKLGDLQSKSLNLINGI